MAEPAESRARSFIERYVIARAGSFRPGADGKEDAWNCTLEAKSAYRMIAEVSRNAEPDPFPLMAMPAGPQGQAGAAPRVPANVTQPYVSHSPIRNGSGLVGGIAPPVGSNPPKRTRPVFRGVPIDNICKDDWACMGLVELKKVIDHLAAQGDEVPDRLYDAVLLLQRMEPQLLRAKQVALVTGGAQHVAQTPIEAKSWTGR